MKMNSGIKKKLAFRHFYAQTARFRKTLCIFAAVKRKNDTMMEAIIERTPKTVTVRMSTRRWDRLQKMEQAYKLSRIIKRSMKQAETAPAMTVDEAMNFIDKL
jgi:16S rRNA U1498 N3-methylase RsmE